MNNRINYIVVGTGRCGTVYLARVLTSLDIPCGHETIFTHHGLNGAKNKINNIPIPSKLSTEYGWDWVPQSIMAESSYLAAPYLNDPLLKNAKIIHLVRNPIRVIFSYCDAFRYFHVKRYPFFDTETFFHERLLEIGTNLKAIDNAILRATMFYIKWNETIEEKCVGRKFLFHRIEDNIQPVLDFIGKSDSINYFKDKKVNTRRHGIFSRTIHDIPDSEVKEMLIEKSKEYGYDLFSDEKPFKFMMF